MIAFYIKVEEKMIIQVYWFDYDNLVNVFTKEDIEHPILFIDFTYEHNFFVIRETNTEEHVYTFAKNTFIPVGKDFNNRDEYVSEGLKHSDKLAFINMYYD